MSEIKQVLTHKITLDEFKKLEVDDVNYKNKIFVIGVPDDDPWRYLYTFNEIKDVIENKWMLSHTYRLSTVEDESVFYVENCDLQCCDSQIELLSLIFDDGYELYYITRGE